MARSEQLHTFQVCASWFTTVRIHRLSASRWFWKAVREVFPETREQRCWFHVGGNVLAALPKSAHPGAKAALAEIYTAEDREHAVVAARAFEDLYGAKWAQGGREDH